MKRLFYVQAIIFAALVSIYGVGYWSINYDQQVQAETVSMQAQAPEGMRYYEYCDGGTSNQLTATSETGCLAERPGDFAKFALAVYMVLFYLLCLAIGFGRYFYLRRHTS
jgi:TRAP-type C4-dicarboxylate transport system permease small subunit